MSKNKYKEEHIKKLIDGVNYMGKYVKITKAGDIYQGICPFHNEKTPSFKIYPKGFTNSSHEKQEYDTWYCFGCHKGGDIIKFKQYQDDINSRDEAVEKLAEEFDITFEEDEEYAELKLALKKLDTEEELKSLTGINLMCSIIGRNCKLKFQGHKNQELAFNKIDQLFQKLDYELRERSALEAQNLIKWFNNEIIKIYQTLL